MNALRQLLMKLDTGAQLSGDDIIALLLLIAMAGSLAHLLTMIITRWGDRNIAVKSLLASIMIHTVCILGLEVFDPLTPRAAAASQPLEVAPETQVEVYVESERDVPLPRSGNVPLADRPVPSDIELMRFPDAVPEMSRTEVPEPEPLPLQPMSPDARDVSQIEDAPEAFAALPADAGDTGPEQPAADDPAAELRSSVQPSQADVYVPDEARMQTQTGEPQRELPPLPDARPSAGARNLDLDVRPTDVAMDVAESPESPIVLPPVTVPDEDDIRRRSAPVTSLNDAGAVGESPNPVNQPRSAIAFRSRLPAPARSSSDRDDTLRNAVPNSLRAQTPVPLRTDYDEVRIGSLASDLSPEITTGGPLAETDVPLIRRRESPPASYQLRDLEQRREAAARYGGTQESEAAVELSLRWLASHQATDGRWDAEDHGAGQVKTDEQGVDRNFAGRDADTGLTALVVLSFLGAGYTHEHGRYAIEVDHALDWLIRQQGSDGNLCGGARHYARMYCHAMATYALAEAWGMQRESLLGPVIAPEIFAAGIQTADDIASLTAAATHMQPLLALPLNDRRSTLTAYQIAAGIRRVDDLRLRQALSRAVTFTLSQQDATSGGWRYRPGQEGDVSMFGWHMMSLKSAEIAGITIDERVRGRMSAFLNSVKQGEHGGLYGYRRNILSNGRSTEPVTPVMTAEALFCRQMLGYSPDSESSRESVRYLLQNLPRLADLNYYYWYYGTLAMYQFGGRPWEQWNAVVRDTLINQQRRDGNLRGSWDPGDPWGRYGGRLYSTALATLTLEVYYRLLPLYRMNAPDEQDRNSGRN